MTHERDIERLLDTWFSDGPTETPDRVIDTVADRIARQPQRPAWRLTWRHHPLNAYLKPLALVAATILVAFLGFNLVGGFKTNSDVAAPSPAPSATPSPKPIADADARRIGEPAGELGCVRVRPPTGLRRAPARRRPRLGELQRPVHLHHAGGLGEPRGHQSRLHDGHEPPGSRRRSR